MDLGRNIKPVIIIIIIVIIIILSSSKWSQLVNPVQVCLDNWISSFNIIRGNFFPSIIDSIALGKNFLIVVLLDIFQIVGGL